MQTYHGSCHCGAVQFEADIDLDTGTIKCNCSICRKARFWPAIVLPDAFRLLRGEDALSSYQFGARIDEHLVCRHCGIRPFGKGRSPRLGDFIAVSVTCLDDVDDLTLTKIPVTYLDGRNDIWDCAPPVTQYL